MVTKGAVTRLGYQGKRRPADVNKALVNNEVNTQSGGTHELVDKLVDTKSARYARAGAQAGTQQNRNKSVRTF
jgi:hypothetical protein